VTATDHEAPRGSRALYQMVEGGRYGVPLGRAFDIFTAMVVVAYVAMAVIGTEPRMMRYNRAVGVFETVCAFLFALEYVLRLAVCTEDRLGRYPHPVYGRIRYALSPIAVIDLLAVLPWLIDALTPIDHDQLLVLRCIPLFKLLRYFAAFDILSTVVRNERRPLASAFLLMMILLVMLSAAAYLVENKVQPEAFGSVPRAMWWGIVTLTTVGYGDVVPATTAGKLIGALALILGMGMFALPAGIIANGFAEEMRRRNFVVTWHLVAKVPMFEHLPAARIAEICAMLQPQAASRGEAIMVKGERGDGMYFLVDGEVEVLLDPSIRLYSGDYFGEIALVHDRPRSATVVARRFSQLLKLRVDHFRRLTDQDPSLAASIREMAEKRLKAGPGKRVGSPPVDLDEPI
jgi:voltage-gated potassium channel